MKLAVALLLVGCAGEIDNPARFADCPPGYVEQVFQAKCGECHGANEPDAFLDLASPGVDMRVKDAESLGMCEGRVMVDSQGGDHLLLEKLEAAPSCGSRMPLGKQPLTAAETECVRRWVEGVAGGTP